MSRTAAMLEHPSFPWLTADVPAGVERLLASIGWLEPSERFLGCDRAGDGNMNLTLRVRTDHRTVILKQARPWVEKYDHIPAPWDRILFEQRFYQRVQAVPDVSARMPRFLAADTASRTLLLEDLVEAHDRTDLYQGRALDPADVNVLAQYLAALHQSTHGAAEPGFSNHEMRALNHEHIYRLPLDAANGLALETHEPGLTATARALQADAEYVRLIHRQGEHYLTDGPVLLHGDFFPGSWLQTIRGPMVIDPEFCFYGPAEFDLGCAIAHFTLAQQPPGTSRAFLNGYRRTFTASPIDDADVARFAAAEIMRRLIGVAQLPIPPSRGLRQMLLQKSRAAMLTGTLDPLCN